MIVTSSKSTGEEMNTTTNKGKMVYSTDVVDQKLSEMSKSH